MREMIKVIVYYDGTWEVENVGLCNYATQHGYTIRKGKSGEYYYCPKRKEEYYKKKLVKDILKSQKEKVIEEQEKLDSLELLLKNIG